MKPHEHPPAKRRPALHHLELQGRLLTYCKRSSPVQKQENAANAQTGPGETKNPLGTSDVITG